MIACRWGSVLAVAFGALLPWYRVPADAPIGASIGSLEPGITWAFRGLCVLMVVLSLAPKLRSQLGLRATACFLAALLLYPTAIVHTAPEIVARGAWISSLHDELTGYAGDIYTSQESRDAEWQSRTLVVDDAIPNRIAKAPTWAPWNLEWGRMMEFAEWIGLAPWFGQCLARGWVLAVAGAVLLLIARLAAVLRGLVEPKARTGFERLVHGCCAVVCGVWFLAGFSIFACAHQLARARDLVRGGDYAPALAALHRAASFLPPLGEDGAFFLQVGRLEAELQRATPAAAFYRAQRLAEEGFAQQARDAMLAELAAAAPGSVAQRELVKGLLSRAIAELNSGQANPAIALLETILAADPSNLKANYVLQIACARAGRLDQLHLLAARMKETYRFLNTPTKRSVLGATQEHLASAELSNGTPAQALVQWRYARRLPK